MKIGIIGAGWYGCHLALSLKQVGHEVILFEKNKDIFQQISGNFGIRLHLGPHYPRSSATRENCRNGFDEFLKRYPELIVYHSYSIYGLGNIDADYQPSKVNQEQFELVCKEISTSQLINPQDWGYQNLIQAVNIQEPSIVIGERLRKTFKNYLQDASIKLVCNFNISEVIKENGKTTISNGKQYESVDILINASSYQSILPIQNDFPFDMEVVYQPCLALKYIDQRPDLLPFSFIVVDGWFPCLMPCVEQSSEQNKPCSSYILTHGKWTIMGSYHTPTEANQLLSSLDNDFIEEKIKLPCESEMNRFWPEFSSRFKYIGWKGAVLAKLKTATEFRSAVTFRKDEIIYIIPGKVSNIFDAEREVNALINNKNIISNQGYQYMREGILDVSLNEITEKPKIGERNTCTLQTYDEVQKNINSNLSSFWLTKKPKSCQDSFERSSLSLN